MVGVIGHPVRHSLSPLLHNTAFAALGLDWVSLAFEVAPGEAAAALGGMRALGVAGLSVTMPHKAEVAALVDECSEVAATLGAVNCVTNRDGTLRGDNTDGAGFLASLERAVGLSPEGRRCLVVGAGGAARAVVLALAGAHAAAVAVVNRTSARAAGVAALAGDAGPGGRGRPRSRTRGGPRRPGGQRHARGHERIGRRSARRRLGPPPVVAPPRAGGGRPHLRPPSHALAGRCRRRRCGDGRRPGDAGPSGGGPARAVDGLAGSGRSHVAGGDRGGRTEVGEGWARAEP